MLEFTRIPHKIETILQAEESGFYENLARQFFRHTDFLYLGRGIHYPIALEGALKLKEISYIHAEGYPSGEMKHGPNALIDENLPVVVLATRDDSDPASVTLYEKSVSNIKEVKARDGIVISIVTDGTISPAKPPTTSSNCRRRRNYSRRCWRSFLCNFSPITSPCAAAATSTNHAILRNPSPSNSLDCLAFKAIHFYIEVNDESASRPVDFFMRPGASTLSPADICAESPSTVNCHYHRRSPCRQRQFHDRCRDRRNDRETSSDSTRTKSSRRRLRERAQTL